LNALEGVIEVQICTSAKKSLSITKWLFTAKLDQEKHSKDTK